MSHSTGGTEAGGPVVGIDLGTTNSVVAALMDGRVQVLVEDGESLMPSVVGVDAEDKLITGYVARNQLIVFPDRTVASVKRKMGTMEPLPMGAQTYTPPEISAMILRRLRDRAARALGQPVTRAVITVPAFFDAGQRQATREAGELAGLKVERIINEPTAATLVYHAGSDQRKHVVVYDLGGGTFDVSVVRKEAGVVEVLSSKGDTQLGGDDFDALLMQHVANIFFAEHQVDLQASAISRFRLKRACEQAKQQLSWNATVRVTEEFIAEKDSRPLNLDVCITRDEYEGMIAPLIDRTVDSVDQALRDAGLTMNQIDDLVLVGGSTRTPLVERRLRDEFLREPSRAIDPDLAVALGAATQAAMLEGLAAGPVLVDVTSHTLGIEVLEGFGLTGGQLAFSPMIHRNSPLPAHFEDMYYKMHEDQRQALIHVLQGEHKEVERNRSIGEFMLDLESGGGDRNKIVVRFDLTLDGTLKVTATQSATGITKQLNIDNALSKFQSTEREQAQTRLREMFDASDEILDDGDLPVSHLLAWTVDSAEERFVSPHAETASRGCHDVGKYPAAAALLTELDRLNTGLAQQDAEELQELRQRLEQAVTRQDDVSVKALCEELDDVLFYVR